MWAVRGMMSMRSVGGGLMMSMLGWIHHRGLVIDQELVGKALIISPRVDA